MIKQIDETWKQHAKCKGMNPSLFHELYEQSRKVQIKVNKICNSCPVQKECQQYAQDMGCMGGVYKQYIPFNKKKGKKNASQRVSV